MAKTLKIRDLTLRDGQQSSFATRMTQAQIERCLPFYKDATPVLYENDGTNKVTITNPYATGMNEEGVIPDRVFVVLRDKDGNYYEPMSFEVPNYFK